MDQQQMPANQPSASQNAQSFDALSSWQEIRGGEKLRSQRTRKRHLGRSLLIIILLLLLVGMGAYILMPMKLGYTVLQEKHVFYVQNHPRLSIYDPAGNINVHKGGEGDAITINATTHKGILSQAPMITFAYNSAFVDYSVAGPQGGRFDSGTSVDLDVTVPQNVDLNLNVPRAASIVIEDITGKVKVVSTEGSVDLKHDTLIGGGSIQSTKGNITFANSTLAQDANYSVFTSFGNIDATLSPGKAIHVAATVSRGTIKLDPAAIIVEHRGPTGKFVEGYGQGEQSTASISFDTASGVIWLHKP